MTNEITGGHKNFDDPIEHIYGRSFFTNLIWMEQFTTATISAGLVHLVIPVQGAELLVRLSVLELPLLTTLTTNGHIRSRAENKNQKTKLSLFSFKLQNTTNLNTVSANTSKLWTTEILIIVVQKDKSICID